MSDADRLEMWRLMRETVHELRTPLAVILGHAELIADGARDAGVEQSARAIMQAAEAINQALQRRSDELRASLGDLAE